ncbi:unnamed protein product, partial [Closterium sp. NIES-54]
MASLRVLAFDHEGRPVQFDMWLDDVQLYLLSDSKDSVSLCDLASGAATAPPATADSSTRSQWLTRDVAARLAICNHLPLAECAHFGQHRTAQALYDAVVARYSSPATAALGRLLLPYLFPKLSAFTTIEDLVSNLRASDARYRAAIPAEFLDRNPPPMYITLNFIVTHLPDSLRSVRDHFLSLDPTSLTDDLLEQHLLAAETSAVAASAAAAHVLVAEDVGAASANAKRRSSKGKGGQGGGGGSGGGGGGSGSGGGGSSGGGGGGGTVGGSGGFGGGGGGSGGSGGSGGGGTGAQHVGSGGGQRQQQQRRSETPSPQQLCEWFLRGASGGSCPYVIPTGDRAGKTCGRPHTQHRCFSCLDDAWRAEFGDDVELRRRADLLKSRIAIFDLDFDAILSAMYALSVTAEGDCYRCVPPDPGIAAAALGARESGTLPSTAPAAFTLDSGHPFLPRLCGMHSRLLVSGLPRSLPPLPPSPAPPCLPCVEGRQRATPHSSSFPSATAPLQTLHMDRFGQDLPVLRLHSDKGGEFSSTLLRDFCHGEGILQSFTLLDSPQKNGIAERRIGLVMEVAHTSMIHAAAPHFLWPFAVRYAAHQLNMWPRVSLPKTSPTLHWTGKVGDASVFRVSGSRTFVCDTSADKLSPRAIPCVFLGFVPDAPGWQFYHPTSRRVFPAQDVTFDESVPFYPSSPTALPLLCPHRSSLLPEAVDSGSARGAACGGAEPGGAESEGAETGGAKPGGVETG